MRPRHAQLLGLDHFPSNITEFDVHQFFTYSADERRAIVARHGSRSRVGFAIQLGFLRMTGRPLSNLEAVPAVLLRHLRQHLAVVTPDLATLRTLYQHPRTLFQQQQAAKRLMRFQDLSRGRQGALSRYLRGESRTTRDTNRLLSLGRQWLYEMKTTLPSDRRLRRIVHTAQNRVEEEIASAIATAVPESTRKRWITSVMEAHDSGSRTVLEWLRLPPKRRPTKDLRLQLDKLDYLKSMGVHRVTLDGIDLCTRQSYAAEAKRRRPSRLNELQEPRRTVALVFFLNVRMHELMDEVIALSAMNGRRIVRKASERVRSNDARTVGPLLEAIEGIRVALQDEALPLEKRLELAIDRLPKETKTPSFAARLRSELSTNARRTRPMLRRLVKLPLLETDDAPVTTAMKQLDQLYEQGVTSLPIGVESSFAPRWKGLVDGEDRQQALRAYECAVLQELRQRLRAGTIWANDSIEHRGGHVLFIPESEWRRSRDRHYRQLALSEKPDAHLEALEAALAAGLQGLDEAVTSGAIPIKGRRVCIEQLDKEPEPDDLEIRRRQLVQAVGSIQLPELLVEMDGHVRFSWTILGRPPRSEKELLAVYAAILAAGTELDAAGIALMIPGLKAETIASFMHLLDEAKVLRQAYSGVIEFMRQHAIVERWGDGSMMSSDAMSLEATRHLWRARVDPKHRQYAVGMYTHLLNQWGIVYDSPIVLGERQVGVAIDGALHQTSDANPTRLAIDTHGHTNFGMGFGKFFGLDLCPRLRDLRNRIVYVPRSVAVPQSLVSVVSHDVSIPAIHRGWDGLGRIAASVKSGRTSATVVLRRFGSASRNNPIYRAGTEFGKLQRSLFLLDTFTNPEFRRESGRVLNYGESVHQLQRAIYAGNIAAKQGRRIERLEAISGALTLLTNLVMAWITHRLQIVVDGELKNVVTDEILRHMAPDQFSLINLRGQLRFPIAKNRHLLFDRLPLSA